MFEDFKLSKKIPRQEECNELPSTTTSTPLENQESTRLASFQRWYDAAVGYFDKNEFDLAKTAIEKAATFYVDSDENASYLFYAADIYRWLRENDRALEYINQAILLDPSNCWQHTLKGVILLQKYGKGEVEVDAPIAQFQKALEYATASQNTDAIKAINDRLTKIQPK